MLLVDLAGKAVFILGDLVAKEIDRCEVPGRGPGGTGPSVTFAFPHHWQVRQVEDGDDLPQPLLLSVNEFRPRDRAGHP